MHQSGNHGGHHAAARHSLALDQAKHLAGCEMVDHDVSTTDDGDRVGCAPAIRVEEGDRVQQDRCTAQFREGSRGS